MNEQDLFDFTTLAKRLREFIKTKKLHVEVPDLLSSSSQIEKFINDLHFYALEVQQTQMECRIPAWKRRIRSDFWYGGRYCFIYWWSGTLPTRHGWDCAPRMGYSFQSAKPTDLECFLERFVDY